MVNGALKRFSLFVVSAFLLSCSSPPKAPIQERSVINNRQEVEPMGGELIRHVQRGDTLYSIAFSTGLDVNQIAAWNGLQDTSRINVGQIIRLTRPIGFNDSPANLAAKSTGKNIEPRNSPVGKSQVKSQHETQYKPQDNPTRKPSNKSSVNTAGEASQSLANNQARSIGTQSIARWDWPTNGKVVTWFSPSKGKQGIDILGQKKQAIATSAAGEVVYVGNGLKGYGNLVIVKHSKDFLSAYAHNDEVLVAEGQRVERHKVIATMGADKTRRSILHFQIRKNGKPVNPLEFLVKK